MVDLTPEKSADFRVIDLPDGVVIDLPRRDIGTLRKIGMVVSIVGLIPIAIFLFSLWRQAPWHVGGSGLAAFFPWLMLFFELPFLLVGLGLILLALALRMGHSRIELVRGQLRASERLGPLGWSWSRPAEDLTKLSVIGDVVKGNAQPIKSGGEFCAISAEFANAKAIPLALGYPRPLLCEIVEQLARRCERFLGRRPAIENLQGSAVSLKRMIRLLDIPVPEPAIVPDDPPVPQPADSQCLVDRRTDGLTITVPPEGLRKGSKTLFGFSLLWNGFMTVFTALMVGGMTHGQGLHDSHGDSAPVWVAVLFLSLFWGIGAVLLLSALNMARRRAVLDVVGVPGHTLLITQQNLFGAKQQEWPYEKIAAVKSGPSGTEVNDQPVPQLQVMLQDKTKIGLLTGRDDDELAWLAYELRQALALART